MALPSTRPTPISHRTLPDASVRMMERHYTVKELADQWGFSYDFIHQKFRDEPGVIRLTRPSSGLGRKNTTRAYGCLRIPESVAMRFYATLVVAQ